MGRMRNRNRWVQIAVLSLSGLVISGLIISGLMIIQSRDIIHIKSAPKEITELNADGNTMQTRILPPANFTRVEQPAGSLAEFLRSYPMKPHGSKVTLYNGKNKKNLSAHAAVFALPLENADLQQCADSVMRVYAEYYYQKGQTEKIKFHFTNGFACDFDTWKQGNRVEVNGNDAYWVPDTAADASYESFVQYLQTVFTYAGTLSMTRECTPISEEEISIGDVFLKGGSPGHVVMVVDMCEDATGRKAFLLAQGFMPAQEFHVLKNPSSESPWYFVDEITYPFHTPEYVFDEGSLMRPEY